MLYQKTVCPCDAKILAAIVQARLVFDSEKAGLDALEYLQLLLDAAPQSAPATSTELDVDAELVLALAAGTEAAALAEQQIERAERATASMMSLVRRCQLQEEQIASLIAALGAMASSKQGRA